MKSNISLLIILLLLPTGIFADWNTSHPINSNTTIPKIHGENFLHVHEDITADPFAVCNDPAPVNTQGYGRC